MSAGKGDSPRPVNRAAWEAAWERIKAKKEAEEAKGKESPKKPAKP